MWSQLVSFQLFSEQFVDHTKSSGDRSAESVVQIHTDKYRNVSHQIRYVNMETKLINIKTVSTP